MTRKVGRACHALALEEERDAFRPVLWDDRYVRDGKLLFPVTDGWTPPPHPNSGKPHIDNERISQVWFVGVHCDIGGGYSRDGLAHSTLAWMIERAKVYGLAFVPIQEQLIKPRTDPYDKLNDSRHGVAGYYRYRPRRLSDIYSLPPYKLSLVADIKHIINIWKNREDPEIEVKAELADPKFYLPRPAPKVHHSVLDRVRMGTDGYAPDRIAGSLRRRRRCRRNCLERLDGVHGPRACNARRKSLGLGLGTPHQLFSDRFCFAVSCCVAADRKNGSRGAGRQARPRSSFPSSIWSARSCQAS